MQDTPWSGFADYLREAMRRAGLSPDMRGSKAELARRSGVPDSVLSRWLTRGTQPEIENLRKISPVLRLRMPDLLIAGGYLSRDELRDAATRRTPEESVLEDPRLAQRDKRLILTMLAEMRERTSADPNETDQPSTKETFPMPQGECTA